jgi:hypothetical protein
MSETIIIVLVIFVLFFLYANFVYEPDDDSMTASSGNIYVDGTRHKYLEDSAFAFSAAPSHLRNFEKYLNQAEVEFAKGAILPFWESIEKAARESGRLYKHINTISSNAHSYLHNCPDNFKSLYPFPVNSESMKELAPAQSLSERMDEIVYRAKCDFQFASIFEQKRTNEILIAGFNNLGDALDRLTWQVDQSIKSLEESVDKLHTTVAIHGIASHLRDSKRN